MIETQVRQQFRVVCDHCGKGNSEWVDDLGDARRLALGNGMLYSSWLQQGCARELWLCDGCMSKYSQDRSLGIVVADLKGRAEPSPSYPFRKSPE